MQSITLKAARVNVNLTQREAAEKIGVSVATIKNWEAGKTFPKVSQIQEISKAYNMPYNQIIFF